MLNAFKKIKNLIGCLSFTHILIYVFSIIQALLTVYFALTIKDLVNVVSVINPNLNSLIICAVKSVATIICVFVLGLTNKLIIENLKVKSETKLKSVVYSGYVNNNYKNLKDVKSGELISIMNKDTAVVSSLYVTLLPAVISTIIKIVATIAVLIYLQPIFTIIVLFIGVAIVLITYFVRKSTAKLYKETLKRDSESASFLTDTINNSLLVKSMHGESVAEKYNDLKLENLKIAKKNHRFFSAIISNVTSFLFMFFYVATLIWCAVGIYKGVSGINFGVLTAMLQLVMQIKSPLSMLSGTFTSYYEMIESLNRILNLLNYDKNEDLQVVEDFEEVILSNVCFNYEDGNEIIKDLSLTIKKGEKVVILGQSGIGKSTLLKILTGVYSVNSGKAIIKTKKCEIKLSNAKNVYSTVFQGNLLFNVSIKENICLFKEYEKEEYLKAVRVAGLEEVINNAPNGEDTIVGEMATSLSQGQAERVAIARALYTKNPILVLDEATSGLDDKTEKQVIESILENYDITIIAVSHKNAIEKYADSVYTFKEDKFIKVK